MLGGGVGGGERLQPLGCDRARVDARSPHLEALQRPTVGPGRDDRAEDIEPVFEQHPGDVGEECGPVAARDVDLPLVLVVGRERDARLVATRETVEQLHLTGDCSSRLREQVGAGRVLDALTL